MEVDAKAESRSGTVVARMCLAVGLVLYVTGIVLPEFRYEYARNVLNESALGTAIIIEMTAAVFAVVAWLIQRERRRLFNSGLLLLAVVASSLVTLRGVQA